MNSPEPEDSAGAERQSASAYAYRIEYQGHRLVVWLASPLLGPAGLPVAVARYERGEQSAEDVARAFVRARIYEADPGFDLDNVDVSALALRVAGLSRPVLPAGTVDELADALVVAQHAAEERVARGAERTRESILRGTEWMRAAAAPMVDFLDRHPELQEALLVASRAQSDQPPLSRSDLDHIRSLREARQRASQLSSSDREAVRRHADKAVENLRRAEAQSRPQRFGLQQQLMVPSELARGIGHVLNQLQQSVAVPPGLAQLRENPRLTDAELVAATTEAAQLVRDQGEEEGAEVLELALAVLSSDQPEGGREQQQDLVTRFQRLVAKHGTTAVMLVITLIGVLCEHYLDRLDPPPNPAPVVIVAPETPDPAPPFPEAAPVPEQEPPPTEPEPPQLPPELDTGPHEH